jgi:hypothetical protein
MARGLELGSGGRNIASLSDVMTLISTVLIKSSKISCWELLPWLSERAGSRNIALNHWLKAQSKVPSHMWNRPFGNWANRIPPKTQKTCLASFYHVNSGLLQQQSQAGATKSLPFTIPDKLSKRQVTDLDKAIAQLTMSPAFFACCSCKYLNVPRRELKRTKLLCLQNISFFKDRCLLVALSDNLEFAESVAVTFKMQKNNQKHDTVIRGWTDNPVL